MTRLALPLVLLVLSGCVSGAGRYRLGPVEEMIPPQPDRCGLADLPDLRAQPMARLAEFTLVGPLRVLWPGQEVTDDIRPDRLNAQVDVTGRINRLFCG